MVANGVGVPPDPEFGQRVKAARIRRGMSRDAVAALCGRSTEWLRQIERGNRGTGLKMVVRLAEVLKVPDLTDLLGNDELPTVLYARPEHPALGDVRRAMSSYVTAGSDPLPPSVDNVWARVRNAWQLRAVSTHDRSDLAAVLPRLLVDAQRAARTADTPAGHRALAEVYHLGQLYLCYQDAPELLWVVVDRGMSAALESEDAAAFGRAAWFSAYLYRDFGHVDQAHQVVDDALRQLDAAPEQSPTVARQRCIVHLASAWNHARDGQPARAWRDWDAAVDADRVAAEMPAAYVLFGASCDDVALTLDVELGKIASASRRANSIDVNAVGSLPRRTRLMIEATRGQMLKREYAGAVHLLRRAQQTSPEATLFSAYARSITHELQAHAGPMLRGEVASLAESLGVPA